MGGEGMQGGELRLACHLAIEGVVFAVTGCGAPPDWPSNFGYKMSWLLWAQNRSWTTGLSGDLTMQFYSIRMDGDGVSGVW